MMAFTALAFGLCAALLEHPTEMSGPDPSQFIMIGTLKQNGKQCDMFFLGNSTYGNDISLNGHAVSIDKMEDDGFRIIIDGERFIVRKGEDI